MENENASGKNKKIAVAVAVALVLVAGAYFFFGGANNKSELTSDSIAVVNGSVILKTTYDAQLNNAIASYKAQGVDVENAEKFSQIKKEVLDGLVNNELLSQNISAAGIKTTEEEVEKQFQLILTQTGGADNLKSELVKNNLTEAQLRENISKQLAIQAYLSQNVDVKSITVGDDEIQQFYANYSKAQEGSGQKLPALIDVSAEIKQQLISNKQQTLVTNFINTLRAKAKIETSAI